MKHLPSSFMACLIAVFFFTAARGRADDSAKPDYKTLVRAMFDKATSCQIEGNILRDKLHDINYSTPDAGSLQKLKEIFLREKPRYLGTDVDSYKGLSSASNLYFIWFDSKGKKLNHLALVGGDILIFNNTDIFIAPWKEGDGAPLLARAADFAVPGIYGDIHAPRATK